MHEVDGDLGRAMAVHAGNRGRSANTPLARVCRVLLHYLEAPLPLALLSAFSSLGSATL